jgi:AAA15 family ATPase/GTPase
MAERAFAQWWHGADGREHALPKNNVGAERACRNERFLKMLQAADVGIVDVKLTEADEDEDRAPSRVLVRHRSSVQNAWLPLLQESHGTRQLFHLAPSILDALETGSVVLIDELEASFHPLLALHLLRMFNDPSQNPRSAQLIFSTHDTNLLGTVFGKPPLRRDQVWLTEKDAEGATRLYPLTDYKPRKAENLERGYLQDRYGAIPFLGDIADVGKTKE